MAPNIYAYWITRAPYHYQKMTPAGNYLAGEGACDKIRQKYIFLHNLVMPLVIIYSSH